MSVIAVIHFGVDIIAPDMVFSLFTDSDEGLRKAKGYAQTIIDCGHFGTYRRIPELEKDSTLFAWEGGVALMGDNYLTIERREVND